MSKDKDRDLDGIIFELLRIAELQKGLLRHGKKHKSELNSCVEEFSKLEMRALKLVNIFKEKLLSIFKENKEEILNRLEPVRDDFSFKGFAYQELEEFVKELTHKDDE